MLNPLMSQSRLSIVELDSFLSQFLATYVQFTTKNSPVTENLAEEEKSNDIDLENKHTTLQKSLDKYETSIKRSLKSEETGSLIELDKWRIKQITNHMSFIKSFRTDSDTAKRAASINYEPLLEQYRNIYKKTNSAQSATIAKYINAIQNDTYQESFKALGLEERTNELKETNDKYIKLSEERTNKEKNRSTSPSLCRQQCINDYRSLVSLINFAEKNNTDLLYTEMIEELAAQTIKMQELIRRRLNAVNSKKKEQKPNIQIKEVSEGETGKEMLESDIEN